MEEGGSRDVTVTATLNGAPLSNDVVLTVSVEDDSAEESTDFEAVSEFDVTIQGGSSAGSQVFTLTPISDQKDEGDETLLVSATTSASLAVGPSPGLVLKIIDDDTAGVTITPVELSFAEGASDTYSVVLDSEPSDTVRIEMSRSGSSDVTVSPSQLTFTTSDWATAHTVTVNSEQDDDSADDSATIKHTVQGGDYQGRTARGVQVTVTDDDDDDAAGLVLGGTPVTVDEGAGSEFTVALATQPAAMVTVTVTSDDTTEATVSPPSLTFATANWDTAQTVTVTGAQDPDIADETLDVILNPVSSDTAYSALGEVTVDVTVTDNVAAGLPVLSGIMVWGEERLESEVWAIFFVELDTAMSAEMTLEYATADGTARAGEDYVAKSGTVTIRAGATSASVLVDLVEDSIAEPDETVVLRVNIPSDETQQAISGTALIIDDDNVGVLDIGDAKRREWDAHIPFEVTLSRPSANDVAVDYETVDGTATAGQDYVAKSGTLTIPAGELAASIKVALLDDSIDEIHERFTVELGNAENAYMGDSSGTGTITDGDPLPVMVVGVVEAAESEPEVELTVTLTSISSRLITANYITFDHTAVGNGVDYVTTAGSLRFEPGETHKTITILIVDDDLNEGDETFTVILKNIKNARNDYSSHSVTILDDDGHSFSNARSRTTNNEERFPAVANRTVWIGVRASRPRRAGLHPAGNS